jgi:glycosyltransferase involved in cell wall biosynthesis
MNIVILQDYLRSGGTERQSILLGRAFAAAGHATALVTFRPGGALWGTARPLEPRALQPFDLGLDWFAPGLGRAVRDRDPAIVLAMGRMANCRAGRLQRLLDRSERRGAVVATLRTGKPLPWLFRRSLRAVRHVVANSEEARERLTGREGLPAGQVTVIPNALVFPPRTQAPAGPLRSRLGAGALTTVLVCVAMFRPEKNQRELVEIAAGLPRAGPGGDWQLWLAGDGPARPACERLARERGLQDRVKFPGFLPDPGELYGAADLAVHASRSESLSNFLIEAQAHGLPAVAYAAQGVGECFEPGRTGWVIPAGDRAAFRAALAPLLAEPRAARAVRGEAARQFARSRFDPDRQVRAYLELFARLAP